MKNWQPFSWNKMQKIQLKRIRQEITWTQKQGLGNNAQLAKAQLIKLERVMTNG